MTEHRDPLGDVMLERAAQDRKWGEQNHPDLYWLAILTEEVGELAQALIEGRPGDAHHELVQVTAVGLAWLEALERLTPPHAVEADEAPCRCTLELVHVGWAVRAVLDEHTAATCRRADGAIVPHGPRTP